MNRTIFELYFTNINEGYHIFGYQNRTNFHLNFSQCRNAGQIYMSKAIS